MLLSSTSALAWRQSCRTGKLSLTLTLRRLLTMIRSLDELDDDLLHELNQVARENQLAYLPFARSGRAEALLFEQYPELAERIERGKRAKIDAIVLSNKYASADTPSASFRAQSLEEVSASPLRQRNRRRTSNHARVEAKSPALTPQLKGKNSAADLMFEMSDGEDEDGSLEKIKPPKFTNGSELPTDQIVGTPDSPWPAAVKQRQSTLQGNIEDGFISPSSLPPSALSGTRTPNQPWGTAPLASSKLDLKDIMAQTSSDKPSGLALGLAREERERAHAAQPKMSQKERKKLQQAQQQGLKIEAVQPAPPAVSPWQAASYRKPSANQILAPSAATPPPQQVSSQPSPQSSPQPSRAQSTPQLTMRQTIAKGKGKGKGKDKDANAQEASSPSRPAASERGMSVSNTPIPVPMSVRHLPLPSHSPTSPSQNLSMMEILSLQEAEKTSIRDAAAKRSLEEIQQEQEFQQWWEAESKRAIQEEEQAKRAAERAAKSAGRTRGKGRGGGHASASAEAKPAKGKDGKKEKKVGEAADGQRKEKTTQKARAPKAQVPKPPAANAQPATAAAQTPNPEAPAFVPPAGPKADSGANSSRNRSRGGHRGGRGGAAGARVGRPSGPPRDVQSAPAASAQHA